MTDTASAAPSPAPVVAGGPTVDSSAELAALRRRVARLEALAGIVTACTIADLDDAAALALVGGDHARVELARSMAAPDALEATPISAVAVADTPPA